MAGAKRILAAVTLALLALCARVAIAAEPDLTEPPPAPLLSEQPPPISAAAPAKTVPARPVDKSVSAEDSPEAKAHRLRIYDGVAWSSAAATLALITAGTVLGVLAQHRSDDLSQSTTQFVDGQPPIFDAAQRDMYTRLQKDGQTYNRAMIACLLLAGVTAVTSGVIFWDASKIRPPEARVALVPGWTASGGTLALVGSF